MPRPHRSANRGRDHAMRSPAHAGNLRPGDRPRTRTRSEAQRVRNDPHHRYHALAYHRTQRRHHATPDDGDDDVFHQRAHHTSGQGRNDSAHHRSDDIANHG
jgi:hypothetical protein